MLKPAIGLPWRFCFDGLQVIIWIEQPDRTVDVADGGRKLADSLLMLCQ